MEQLFCGKPIIVAKNVNYDTAMRYKQTFDTAGAICSVEKFKPEQSATVASQPGDNAAAKVDPSDIIACPKCGFEQQKNEECGKCGIIISKYSDSEGPTPRAIPQSRAPLYFSVSQTKLILMSIFTLGIYEIYWFYKNWNHIKIRTRQKIRPFWRAIFSVFYCYALFKEVQESTDSHRGSQHINPGWLAVGYVLLSITYKLPDPFWAVSMLAFLPLIPVQGAINRINATVAPKSARNSHFSGANILVMIIGSLFLALATVGTIIPSSFLDISGQSAWEDFYSDDGYFSVSLPGKPEKETENIKTQVGTISRQSFVVEKDGGQTTYLVMSIDYPKDAIEMVDHDQILNSVRDDVMATYRGTVNQEDWVQMDNYPGQEFDFEGKWKNSSVFGNVMTLLIEKRLYMLLALGVDEEVDAKDVEKFFVSFESLN
jgi:hypothetical protein